ncbi:hypothetical protein ACBY01_01440 [Sphingomonas sp. ac-8]|uniref:hypothetical protein n=1 Tax=Sphingomonas sp. ac-8 TaxID=3242977 RepID=UPI003A80784F
MPRKKPSTVSLPVVAKPAAGTRLPLREDGGLVMVDAVHRVEDVHPTSDGPWSTEADKIAWTDPASGYPCIIRRSPLHQHLCGYVAVPPGHPLYGREYGTLFGIMIGVHGGIDYSDVCERDAHEDRSICHVAADVGSRQEARRAVADNHDDDAWWFGFSCDQRDDLVPSDTRRPGGYKTPAFGVDDPTYKTEAFVYGECVRLAAQLKAIEENRDPGAADPGPTVVPASRLEYRR